MPAEHRHDAQPRQPDLSAQRHADRRPFTGQTAPLTERTHGVAHIGRFQGVLTARHSSNTPTNRWSTVAGRGPEPTRARIRNGGSRNSKPPFAGGESESAGGGGA